MYLYRKRYISSFGGYKVTIKKDKKVDKSFDEPIKYVVSEVGYWRKANHIHKWFVDNVQGGVDNCGNYEVTLEQLQELLKTIKIVLNNSELIEADVVNGYTYENGERKPIMEKGKAIKDPTVAEKLLPVTEGFFFGSTAYDEWYYNDCKDTEKIIESVLKKDDSDNYEYHSSW